MSTLLREAAAQPAGHAFDGVRLDRAARRLEVDGVERPCSRLAFELLLAVCERPRAVVPRRVLADRLWPPPQVVSDESLTQAIFRARATLGPYGSRLVTVRGVGLRLDADVRDLELVEPGSGAFPSADVAASEVRSPNSEHAIERADLRSQSATLPTTPDRERRRWSSRRAAFAAALLLLAGLAASRFFVPAPALLYAGYALEVGDAATTDAEVLDLVRRAYAADAGGDRPGANALFKAAVDADPNALLPAIELELHAGMVGAHDEARRWHLESRRRARGATPYARLLHDYADAEIRGDVREVLRTSAAMLALRPDAWRLRLARAHHLAAQGEREAARLELARIPARDFGDRKLHVAIADRASFGDVAGAQAMLARWPASIAPVTRRYVEARLAYSRGDLAAAQRGFLDVAAQALGGGRDDLTHRARTYAALIGTLVEPPAAARPLLEQARLRVAERGLHTETVDLDLVLAQIDAVTDAPDRSRRLDAIAAALPSLEGHPAILGSAWLVLMRLRPEGPLPAPMRFGERLDLRGLEALVGARRALSAGDRSAANAALDAALRGGVGETVFAEEAALLGLELGREMTLPPPPDPMFPPYARFAARLAAGAVAPR